MHQLESKISFSREPELGKFWVINFDKKDRLLIMGTGKRRTLSRILGPWGTL